MTIIVIRAASPTVAVVSLELAGCVEQVGREQVDSLGRSLLVAELVEVG